MYVYMYVAGGPVAPYGALSPSDSDPAGPAGPYVAGGPVGPDGTLSPFISDPAGPAGPYAAGGPVGPDGTLSPFNSDPAGPDGPYVAGGAVGPFGMLSPSDSGSAILVDPGGGMLLPDEGGPKSCPSVLTDDLVLVAAVPLPAVRDPMVTQSPVEVRVGDCSVVTEVNITVHDGWSDPDVVGTPAVVAMVGMNALQISNDTV